MGLTIDHDAVVAKQVFEKDNSSDEEYSVVPSRQKILATSKTAKTNGEKLDYGEDDDNSEHTLLGHIELDTREATDHEVRTAPIFTRDAYIAAGGAVCFPQRGVLGTVLSMGDMPGTEGTKPDDSRLYVNSNAPFSALVCGVQGSGKSHTVSVLLEDMLIPKYSPLGKLEKPLSGLVLHFGEGGSLAQPSEAAWINMANNTSIITPKIKVFVSKSALKTMKAVYAKVGSNVQVEPLLFSQAELDVQAFLSMMAVGSSGAPPLYMSSIMSILHELGEDYTYAKFEAKLEDHKTKLNAQQLIGLNQRMELLESFLDKTSTRARAPPSRFAEGQLTIVDLSDPFLDPSQACSLFDIVTRLFVRANVGTGKVLILDEAHKYLASGSGFTRQLMTLIRMQRHLAMRVIISTQEPNVVPPILLDLCSVHILHRFSSPSWWEHVSKHVSTEMSSEEAFDRIVKLQTGQAILLAPSGLGTFSDSTMSGKPKSLGQFGRKWS
ncbi:hypothetical protein EUX98_g516 [Antrodiella citrinella]|uniref:Zona occludens toxin N-terminal domain-containing protein n=1 Tax=Antrodiella citrinella TaxID=2447956 RepID=A0A4S4N6F7_9APHY|nr:hypothetical protein EUX98_g516 [Antrodiella citrinella]